MRAQETFQGVGHTGREAFSLAQAVYVRERPPPLDRKEPAATDAKPMLDAFVTVDECGGGTNEHVRRFVRSATLERTPSSMTVRPIAPTPSLS